MLTEERFNEIREKFAAANRALGVISGDRLICYEPEDGPSGEVSVLVSTKPPGATQWTTSGADPTVVLTRQPSGEVTQQVTKWGYPVAVTDAQVATELDVDLETWARGREAIESGLAEVADRLGVAAPGEPPSAAAPSEDPHMSATLQVPMAAQSVASARPALMPPEVHPLRPEDRATKPAGWPAPRPGAPI